jgi:hypothetical protein
MSAPTFTVTLNSQLSIVETLNGLAVSPGDNTVTLTGLNETVALTGSTTPPVSAATAFAVTMSGGAATIDLTALPGLTPSETINATGLKGAAIKMSNPLTNANKIAVSQGASNAFRLDAATNWSVVLAPGQSVLFNLDGLTDAVGSTHKTIDLAGTGSQVLNVEIALG